MVVQVNVDPELGGVGNAVEGLVNTVVNTVSSLNDQAGKTQPHKLHFWLKYYCIKVLASKASTSSISSHHHFVLISIAQYPVIGAAPKLNDSFAC